MLIIEVINSNIEKALSLFKYKTNKTKQNQILRDNKEFEKPSITKRKQLQRARHIEQTFNKSEYN